MSVSTTNLDARKAEIFQAMVAEAGRRRARRTAWRAGSAAAMVAICAIGAVVLQPSGKTAPSPLPPHANSTTAMEQAPRPSGVTPPAAQPQRTIPITVVTVSPSPTPAVVSTPIDVGRVAVTFVKADPAIAQRLTPVNDARLATQHLSEFDLLGILAEDTAYGVVRIKGRTYVMSNTPQTGPTATSH